MIGELRIAERNRAQLWIFLECPQPVLTDLPNMGGNDFMEPFGFDLVASLRIRQLLLDSFHQ